MARRSAQEARDWETFDFDGREFVRAKVPKGNNAGQTYTIAARLAERYEVRGFFASGGCGLILRGRDLHTETDVLIKTTLDYNLVHEAHGRDIEGMRKRIRDTRRQLQTERRIMVLLKNLGCNGVPNPNDYVFDHNPALIEHKAADGSTWRFESDSLIELEPYLIMEQIDGRPVEDLIGRGMPEERALRIIQQVAYVLSQAHRPITVKGKRWEIIYQDLKPANILVGAHDYVSLLDWGGCRLYLDGTPIPAMAGANTPGFCAPECESQEKMTQAFDSYTVGSTLYHMLTGTPPSAFFSSAHSAGARKALRHNDWDEAALKKKAGSATVSLVLDCLRDEPRDRPQNGTELHARLASLLR
jgi:serine/threonine protein kinase